MATDVKNDATLSTSLTHYYQLEESSGTRVDSKGSSDLTDVNTVTSATGIQGTGAFFTKLNDEKLTTTSMWCANNTSKSYMAWYKATSTIATIQTIFCNGNGTTDGNHGVSLILNGTPDIDGTIALLQAGVAFRKSTTQISDTNWHQFIVTFNSSSHATIYLDGNTTPIYGPDAVTWGAITGAGSSIGGEINAGRYAGGTVDEVATWDKELSTGEVTSLWNGGAGLPYDAGGAPVVAPQVHSTLLTLGVG